MQISSTPTAYGGGEAQRLLSLLLQQRGAQAGQDVPGADSTSAATTPSPAQPSGGTNAAQFTSDTLSSLLSAQEAPPSSSDVAAKVINTADTNGDGALSADEIQTALGSNASDSLTAAIGKLDTNADGQLSATELSAAIDAFRAAHNRGGPDTGATTSSAQVVTA